MANETSPPKTNLSVVDARYVASAVNEASLIPPTLVEIAFAGRSNVGKSSLMNALMNRKNLVRTSSTPGCTRAINFFEARCGDGLTLNLVDLPGYGFAQRSKAERATWGTLIENYLLHRITLRAVVLLVDARRGVEEEEHQLAEFLLESPQSQRANPSLLLVATKLDKVPSSKQGALLSSITSNYPGAMGVSATTRHGIDSLWKRLRKLSMGEIKEPKEKQPVAPSTSTTPSSVEGAEPS